MLRQVVLGRKLALLRTELEALNAKAPGFEERQAALETRAAELEAAINEITEQTPQDDQDALDAVVTEHEAAEAALETEQAAHQAEVDRLGEAIRALEAELAELNERAAAPAAAPAAPAESERAEKREGVRAMENRTRFYGMTMEQRGAFFAREDVRSFLAGVRDIKTRGVTNGSLTIPDIVLDMLRDNLEQFSKLARFVTVKRVNGTARQNIMGAAPEGVWMEATGALNELDMSLNQIEVDGYMVGGIIWVHNTLLEDSDIALGSEIMTQLGMAIGKGVDRAILFGTGTKTPVGIATRLAQTSEPDNWGANAPTWTDLHTKNVLKLNIDGTTGAAFYASLIAALGTAKPNYTDGRCFWVMNRKTHIKLMTKALAFDAAAALLAGVNNQMPIIGGEIVELELMGDNAILGGYGSAYLLAERAGAKVESSEHAKFQQLMTGFRGYARYDGMPVFGEAFVIVNFANADAATSSTFPTDYANTDLGVLGVTAAASATAAGKTVLTVTGTESTGTTLRYKIGDYSIARGQVPVGYTALTSAETEITAAAGTTITVVELDGKGKAIKAGKVIAVPKAS